MSTYTNRFGQTLAPGDQVVVIAQGYNHSIKERPGTFVGVSAGGSPQVRVKERRWRRESGHHEVEAVRTYSRARVYRLG